MKPRIYYVYKVDVDGITRYYGKGSGSRYLHATSGNSTCEELNSDIEKGKSVQVSFVETGLTSNEAIALERKMIERDFDSLYNRTIAKTLRGELEKSKAAQANRSYVDDMIKYALSSEDTLKIGNVTLKNITQFWKICEMQSAYEGNKADKSLHHFLKNVSTKEFISVLNDKYKSDCVHIIGTAAKAQTYAPVDLLFFAGKKISTEFHLEVIDAFINNKILEWRDVSGNEFKALNIAIDNYLPYREGKSNKGIYINTARMLLSKVNPNITTWNDASADELRERASIENKLVTTLQLGLIKDWEHMKEIIEKI